METSVGTAKGLAGGVAGAEGVADTADTAMEELIGELDRLWVAVTLAYEKLRRLLTDGKAAYKAATCHVPGWEVD